VFFFNITAFTHKFGASSLEMHSSLQLDAGRLAVLPLLETSLELLHSQFREMKPVVAFS
jgi:hypothetical protein